MFEALRSGGWVMAPILLCSVAALAICIERGLVLRQSRVAPKGLLDQVLQTLRSGKLGFRYLLHLRDSSSLGRIFAAELENCSYGREFMKESAEEAAAQEMHVLEKRLTSLGTIASISPLLGLLGTVVGMIKVFNEIVQHGTGTPEVLAGGIAEALITTAVGITVAVPALLFYRMFLRRADDLMLFMQAEAAKLGEALRVDPKLSHQFASGLDEEPSRDSGDSQQSSGISGKGDVSEKGESL